MDEAPDRWLVIAEVARLFQVDPKTVSRWETEGKLKRNGVRVRRTPGNHRQFHEPTLLAYMRALEA